MDKLSNQTKNLMKLTQELLVSEDLVTIITIFSYWLDDGLMRPRSLYVNLIVSVREEVDACHWPFPNWIQLLMLPFSLSKLTLQNFSLT